MTGTPALNGYFLFLLVCPARDKRLLCDAEQLLLTVISEHRVVQQYAGVVPLMLYKNKTIFHGEVWVEESHRGMKLLCSLVIRYWILLYLLPDSSRVNWLWMGLFFAEKMINPSIHCLEPLYPFYGVTWVAGANPSCLWVRAGYTWTWTSCQLITGLRKLCSESESESEIL